MRKDVRRRRGAWHPALGAFGWSAFACGVLLAGVPAARAADLRVCVDSSSAAVARDRSVAERVATQAGLTLVVAPFDGSGGGQDGFALKKFTQLLTSRCDLVMGYPIDTSGGEAPPGLLTTKPYAQTGFVLVDAPGTVARSLAELPAGTEVAITGQTAPALYFAANPNVVPDIHDSDADTMQSIAKGQAKAAMIWQPTVEQYERTPGAVKLATYPLDEPHARYDLVALYLPAAAPAARLFNATKIAMTNQPSPGGAAPALYTKAQAAIGLGKFIGNCAMCHGAHLEGRSGPSLKGPNWASEKADYTVGEVFTMVSQQMPATAPGSLENADYVNIMAYLLQQNGYPAGDAMLNFDQATGSTVKLRWHGGS